MRCERKAEQEMKRGRSPSGQMWKSTREQRDLCETSPSHSVGLSQAMIDGYWTNCKGFVPLGILDVRTCPNKVSEDGCGPVPSIKIGTSKELAALRVGSI